MPTYEYECTECGAVFELFQPITEPPRRKLKKTDPRPCSCNAPVRRHIGTGAGIIFRGSGFYETDYRSENYKNAAKADREAGDGKAKSGKDGDGKSPSVASPGKTGEKKSQKAKEKDASKA